MKKPKSKPRKKPLRMNNAILLEVIRSDSFGILFEVRMKDLLGGATCLFRRVPGS